MGSSRKLKAALTAAVLLAVGGIGSGRGQDAKLPAVDTPRLDVAPPAIPYTPSPLEQARAAYIKAHTERVEYLTADQLREKTQQIEAEIAEAKKARAAAAREKSAADEFAKAKEQLAQIAKTYQGTVAGKDAQRTLDAANGIATPPPLPELALPPVSPPPKRD